MSTDAVDTAPAQPQDQGDQPVQGQGTGGLYDKYLTDSPEELRPLLSDVLSRYSREAVEPKFREHADFRKTWERYANVEGFDQLDPEEVVQAYNLQQVFNDPSIADEVLADPEAFQQQWEQVGDALGFFEGDEEGDEGGYPEEGQQPEALTQLQQEVQQLRELLTEQQSNSQVEQAKQQISQELDQLQEEHGEFNRDIVVAIAATKYGTDDDAIQKAFADYQSDRGGAQASLLEGKMNGQPEGALSGGQPSSEPDHLSLSDDSAKRAALSRFRGT